jgi:hypothetical protein
VLLAARIPSPADAAPTLEILKYGFLSTAAPASSLATQIIQVASAAGRHHEAIAAPDRAGVHVDRHTEDRLA